MAILDKMPEHLPQPGQFRDLAVDLGKLLGGNRLHIRTGAVTVGIEGKQLPTFLDRQPEAAGPLDETQPVDVLVGIVAVPVGGPVGGEQTDVLVVADRLGRKA